MVKLPYLALMLLLVACQGQPAPADAGDMMTVSDLPLADAQPKDLALYDVPVLEGFQSHTVPGFAGLEEFFAFADIGELPVQCKFVLTRFGQDGGETAFEDPSFYSMHDEWYWYRMLNGVPIEGYDTLPVMGLSFDTVQECVDYCLGLDEDDMPLDLRFTSDLTRLYSSDFYDACLEEGRFFGVGSLVHYPAQEGRVRPEELWLFELEYVDGKVCTNDQCTPYPLTEEHIITFFHRLEAVLPREMANDLMWLTRSVEQERLAEEIRGGGGPLAGRIINYGHLVVPGEVQAYNPGIAAGKIVMFPQGTFSQADVQPDNIVVLEEIPDDIPPVAAIVTAVPQTPLAHINLLAKSRGTPNAYIAGVLDDPGLQDWAHFARPVILKVSEGGATWQLLTSDQYGAYLDLLTPGSLTIPQVDLTTTPYTVDLTLGGLAQMKDIVPLCGGKAAGMMAFQDYPTMEIPLAPLCLTIRAFAEHMSSLHEDYMVLSTNTDFRHDPLVRYLVLEGPEAFVLAHGGDEEALAWMEGYIAGGVAGSVMERTLDGGGFKQVIRDKPLDPTTLAEITNILQERYAALAPTQGLRFRSSSTAEDVPGFNGAGLYTSNTGFLYPEELSGSDRARTVEAALKETWASYWSYGPFEERSSAGIDHLAGNMGVLVHPRFDDSKELANGVITFALSRESRQGRRMVVNGQEGAVSVTNPEPDIFPEEDVVELMNGSGGVTIHRLQPSSLVEAGTHVLSDQELRDMYDKVGTLAEAWLDQINQGLSEEQRSLSVVLDLEFKRMGAGWPTFRSGQWLPERMVYKQVRTLDRALNHPQVILDLPVPRDILAKAIGIKQWTCTAAPFVLATTEVTTDPAEDWPLSYGADPFNAYIDLIVTQAIAGMGAGTQIHLTHPDLIDPYHFGGTYSLSFGPAPSSGAGFTAMRLQHQGDWEISTLEGSANGRGVHCQSSDLLMTATAYLEALLGP